MMVRYIEEGQWDQQGVAGVGGGHRRSEVRLGVRTDLCCSGWSWRWWRRCAAARTAAAAEVFLPRPPRRRRSPGRWRGRSCGCASWSSLAWAACPWPPCCPWPPPWPETAARCRPARTPARSDRSPPVRSAATRGRTHKFRELHHRCLSK